ncbi:hypothetical protein QPK87_27795 [Kamptonema cortianum]|nr:hypothetical protein [Kamptonema cortianum]
MIRTHDHERIEKQERQDELLAQDVDPVLYKEAEKMQKKEDGFFKKNAFLCVFLRPQLRSSFPSAHRRREYDHRHGADFLCDESLLGDQIQWSVGIPDAHVRAERRIERIFASGFDSGLFSQWALWRLFRF